MKEWKESKALVVRILYDAEASANRLPCPDWRRAGFMHNGAGAGDLQHRTTDV